MRYLNVFILLLVLLHGTNSLAANGTFYSIDSASSNLKLVTIDSTNGNISEVGPIGASNAGGLTYNPNTDSLFSIDASSSNGALIEINPATGASNQIGIVGFIVMGIAYDTSSDTLLGIGFDPNDPIIPEVIEIDQSTGAGSSITQINNSNGFGLLGGLAVDSSTGTLYANEDPGEFVAVNSTTGNLLRLSDPLDSIFNQISSLEFDGSTGTLFGLDSINGNLVTIDTTNGVVSPSVALQTTGSLGTLAFAPNVIPEPTTTLLMLLASIGLVTRRR